MNWIKDNWSNILFGILIALLLIPQTGKPIRIFMSRLIAFSPSVESEEDREVLTDYQWKLQDLEGNVVDFQAFKGQKLIVNFWATWCPPCVAEMPSLEELYVDYKDKVVFVCVTNDDEATIRKFMNKHKYSLPIYRAVSSAPNILKTGTLPTTYLINEKGEILIDKTGAADWNSEKVRKLLD